jgi:asparagine synthase (glutamine-hydrolysing)
MCGFVGVIDSERRLEERLVVRMRETIVHRGPDEAGVWVAPDRSVGFGTRRLKIIDLVAGQQPMANNDGSVVLAYNGELYNHHALREELEAVGRRFRTRCDTEVVLTAYEHYGEDCLSRFDGMFALLVWDARRRRLFFARDRAGEKPLYYARTRTGWIFASEIKALLEHPDIGRSVDREAFSHYLSFLTTPPPSTLFEGVFKVPAAHCGSWSEDDGLQVGRWWNLPPREEHLELDEREVANELRRLFAASVEERMMSDVPIGVYLSGGVDSTANVAFMSQHAQRLQTFSVAFSDAPSLDELENAQAVAHTFGTHHREVVLDDGDVIACLPALVHHQDEPIADPVCVPLFHLAQLTKRSGVTVVQIGEGSDESFFGYPVYDEVFRAASRLRTADRLLPKSLLRLGVAGLKPFVGPRRHEFMVQAVGEGLPAPHGIGGFSQRDKGRFLTGNGSPSSIDHLGATYGTARTVSEIADVALAHEFGLRMPELLLMRIDKMTMASSVEARAPFLDPQLVEFAARLPVRLHWDDRGGKRILKRAFEGVVPDAVLERPKRGFGAPVQRWLETLQPLARAEVLRRPIFDYLDESALRAFLDEAPGRQMGFELWTILNFSLWHRHWIEGDDLRETPSFAKSTQASPRIVEGAAARAVDPAEWARDS